MADDTEPRPASGTPAWPDPFPSGPYASVPWPSGPYSSGLSSGLSPTVPLGAPAQAPVTVPAADSGTLAIAQIGEIEVTSTAVRTPIGAYPLRGSRWIVQDQWLVTQKTPTWAIACAVVGFFVVTVFSLLFLLVKRPVYSGVVQVTVSSGPFRYDARIPVTDEAQVQHLHNLVNYVRSVASV